MQQNKTVLKRLIKPQQDETIISFQSDKRITHQ